MSEIKLTPKQEKFAQLYVELGNASEAYRQAYNSKAQPESVHVNASKVLADAKVSLRVEQIRKELSESHLIGLKELLNELEEARQAALQSETPQSSAAVSATMGKAKLLGLDKIVVDHQSSDLSMSPIGRSLADFYGQDVSTKSKP